MTQQRNPLKSRKMLSTVMIIAMMLTVSLSAGALTTTGASGLIAVPSADTLITGEGVLSLKYYDGRAIGAFSFGVFDNLEVGVHTGGSRRNSVDLGLTAKFNLLEETASSPAVAVGAGTNRVYAAVSKRIAPRVRGHLGYGFGANDGIFGGVSVHVNTTSVQGRMSMPPTILMAEIDSRARLNAGARLLISPMWSAEVLLMDMKHLGFGVSLQTNF